MAVYVETRGDALLKMCTKVCDFFKSLEILGIFEQISEISQDFTGFLRFLECFFWETGFIAF